MLETFAMSNMCPLVGEFNGCREHLTKIVQVAVFTCNAQPCPRRNFPPTNTYVLCGHACRGYWASLERDLRRLALTHTVNVATGPLFLPVEKPGGGLRLKYDIEGAPSFMPGFQLLEIQSGRCAFTLSVGISDNVLVHCCT